MRTSCTAGRVVSALVTASIIAGCAQEPARTKQHVDGQMIAELDKGAQRAKPNEPEVVSQALLPPLRMELPQAQGKPIEGRFDLNVNDAPAREVFLSIVSGTRYSMLVAPEVSGTISVNLKDVSLTEALDAIREIYGYEYRMDGSRIYIKPAGLQTRVFKVNYLIGARQGRSDMRVTAGSSGITTNATTPTPTSTLQQTLTGAPVATPAVSGGVQDPPSLTPNAPGALAGIQTDATRMSTAETTDFWGEVAYAIRTIVGTGGGRNIVISPQSGVVVVRAMPQELRSVASLLTAMQVSVDRQVILEAKIIDVTLNHAYQTGINWAAFPTSGIAAGFSSGVGGATNSLGVTGALSGNTAGSSTGSSSAFTANPGAGAGLATLGGLATGTTNVAGGVFGLAVQTRNFASLLQFLQTQGSVQVLSSPRVSTLNNQKAVLKVGTDQPFVTSITPGTPTTVINPLTGTSTSTTTFAPTISNIFAGISLDVTPQIDDRGNIMLHIHPLVTAVSGTPLTFNLGAGDQSITVAKIGVSESDTMVRTTDGNIVVLGGLMQVTLNNGRSGVPGLADAPVIGGAFQNSSNDTVKRELVILIRPTIIDSDKDWEREIQESRDRMQHMDDGQRMGPAGQ
jgi:MSHA biogenesis protein MshL